MAQRTRRPQSQDRPPPPHTLQSIPALKVRFVFSPQVASSFIPAPFLTSCAFQWRCYTGSVYQRCHLHLRLAHLNQPPPRRSTLIAFVCPNCSAHMYILDEFADVFDTHSCWSVQSMSSVLLRFRMCPRFNQVGFRRQRMRSGQTGECIASICNLFCSCVCFCWSFYQTHSLHLIRPQPPPPFPPSH